MKYLYILLVAFYFVSITSNDFVFVQSFGKSFFHSRLDQSDYCSIWKCKNINNNIIHNTSNIFCQVRPECGCNSKGECVLITSNGTRE